MATEEQRMQVRRNTGEVGSTTYGDDELDLYILNAGGNLDLASAQIWSEKSASYAELVDMTEAGSSRKNSDLFKNAEIKAAEYRAAADTDSGLVVGTYSTTRRITRL